MSNACNNTLVIKGKPEDLDALIEGIKSLEDDSPISLERIVPKPDAAEFEFVREQERKWEEENWGCSWVECLDEWESVSPTERQISFYSDFVPPHEWFTSVADAFPAVDLKLTALELGGGLYFVQEATKGLYTEEDKTAELLEFLDYANALAKEEQAKGEDDYIENVELTLSGHPKYAELYSMIDAEDQFEELLELDNDE